MKYSTNNVEVSLTLALAEYIRARGFDIRWQATEAVDTQTVLPEEKGTVTFVPDFPANPTDIVRLNSDSENPEAVVIPAFTLHCPEQPERVRIVGLGHSDYHWQREVRIDGFAWDEFQHRELADLLHDFFNETGSKEIPIYDHDANQSAPPSIGTMQVTIARAEKRERWDWPDACRYYVTATAIMAYEE